jgi:CHAT domain-containing protein/Tfp pilus assembly protein PilF
MVIVFKSSSLTSRLVLSLLFSFTLLFVLSPRQVAAQSAKLKSLETQFDKLLDEAKYLAAQRVAKSALALREKEFGPNHPSTATASNRLGRIYLERGRYREAEPLFRRAVDIMTRNYGKESIRAAVMRTNLATLHQTVGQYEKAERQYKLSLDVLDKNPGPDHFLTAKVRRNLADLYATLARFGEAEPLYRQVLKVQEKSRGPVSIAVATTLNNFADFFVEQGSYQIAEQHYRRALDIFKKKRGSNHPDLSSVLFNLASLKRTQGLFGEAELLLRRSMRIEDLNFPAIHQKRAASHNNLAGLYKDMGRYELAEKHYRKALEMAEKTLGPAHVRTSKVVGNLALFYKSQGRYDEADRLYKRSEQALLKTYGPNHPYVAISYSNRAGLYDKQHKFEQAEVLLKKAVAINKKFFKHDHPTIATDLVNLGWHYRQRKQYDKALKLYLDALAIDKKINGNDHPLTAVSLSNLAVLMRLMGRLDEAEAYARQSLEIKQNKLGANHPGTARIRTHLARIYFAKKQWNKSLAQLRQVTAIYIRRALSRARGNAIREARGELLRHTGAFRGHVTTSWRVREQKPRLGDQLREETFRMNQWAGQSAASAALAQMALRFGTGSNPLAQLVRKKQDLSRQWRNLDRRLIREISKSKDRRNEELENSFRHQLVMLNKQLQQIDKKFSTEFPTYTNLASPRPLSIRQTQKLLHEGEALVSFMFTKKEGYAWLILKNRAKWVRLNINQMLLQKLIKTLRRGLNPDGDDTRGFKLDKPQGFLPQSDGLPFDMAVSYDLYQKLFGDLTQELEGIRHLIFVPSGALGSLPPSVLVTRKPARALENFEGYRKGAWLIRKYAISVLPSVSSLRALRIFAAQNRLPQAPFIGFGDPVLQGPNGDTVKGGTRGVSPVYRGKLADVRVVRSLQPLPDTANELRAIAKSLNAAPDALYMGKAANETVVKKLPLDDYRIIAFATHGLVTGDLQGLAEPALVLTPPDQATETDDGLLGASEVARMKLNADWVLLSACNTASGETPGGEGLSGLARAFFYAGTRALLVSHWPVYSDAAVQLTTGIFKAQRHNPTIGRAEALRRSILALINNPNSPDNAHPTRWAPFVIVGEGAQR